MDCTCQAPPSMRFFRHDYWSGLPFPSLRDRPNPGIEPGYPAGRIDSCRQTLYPQPQKDLNHSATFDEGCPFIALNHRVNKMSNKDIGFYRISSLKVASFLPISSNNYLFCGMKRNCSSSPEIIPDNWLIKRQTSTLHYRLFLKHFPWRRWGPWLLSGWKTLLFSFWAWAPSNACPSAGQTERFCEQEVKLEPQKHEACGGRHHGLRMSAEVVENEPVCKKLGGVLKPSQDIKSQVS